MFTVDVKQQHNNNNILGQCEADDYHTYTQFQQSGIDASMMLSQLSRDFYSDFFYFEFEWCFTFCQGVYNFNVKICTNLSSNRIH